MIIPHENGRDLQEVPDNIKENLDIRPVKWIDEVLEIALESSPTPLSDEAYLAGQNDAKLTSTAEEEGGDKPSMAH